MYTQVLNHNLFCYIVEPPVSDHPKCKDSVVALITCKNRTTGGLFQEEIGAIHFMEDNLLHTLCKLSHVWVHVVTKILRLF